MAKNTSNSAFRKIDIDQYNEDNFRDDEAEQAVPTGPDEGDVCAMLNQGRYIDALHLVLNNAPMGSANQQVKDNALALTLKVLLAIKSGQIEEAVGSLSLDDIDILMKYIYRGFEYPSEGSSGHLLLWHEKAFNLGGSGEPLLGTRNQTWWYRLWHNLSCCNDGVQEPLVPSPTCSDKKDYDDPVMDHQRWAPQCPFLREQQNNGNVPLDGSEVRERDEGVVRTPAAAAPVQVFGPMHPRYSSPAARLFSFKDWPRSKRQKPEELVEAGFFYLGEEDKTKCFFCDGGLKDWEEDDVPWEQHARWFDRCAYVRSVKGRDYIQNVISQVCVIPATEEQKEAVLDPAHASKPSSSTEKKKECEVEDSKLCKVCYEAECPRTKRQIFAARHGLT